MSEIAVIGAGLMGHGIALVLALGGHRCGSPTAGRRPWTRCRA